MESILISVVIPVYNGEKYIEQCVEKLEVNSDKMEIILINDGSQDRSAEICKAMEGKYRNIRFIEQQNGGVSKARNTGVQAAKGTWIVFVDVDDFLDPEIFQDAKSLLELGSTELIHFGTFTDHYISDTLEESIPRSMSALIKGTDICQEYSVTTSFTELFKNNVFDSAWGKFFRKNIILENGIHFCVGMKVREDSEFVLQYVDKIEKVSVLNVYRYHYRVDGEETSYYLRREIALADVKKLQHRYYEVLNKLPGTGQDKALIDKHLFILIMAGIMHMASNKYGGSFKGLKNYIRAAREHFYELFCSVKQTSFFYELISKLVKHKAYTLCSIICKLRFQNELN